MSTPQIDDGGNAFPQTAFTNSNGEVVTAGCYFGDASGMNLRDWFAGKVIGNVVEMAMIQEWAKGGPEWRDAAASEAYKFADAMIAARKETR